MTRHENHEYYVRREGSNNKWTRNGQSTRLEKCMCEQKSPLWRLQLLFDICGCCCCSFFRQLYFCFSPILLCCFFFFSSLLFHSVRSHSVPAAKRSSLVCVLFFRRLTSNWAVDVRVLLENKKYKTRSMKTTSSESWRAAAAWKKGEKKR